MEDETMAEHVDCDLCAAGVTDAHYPESSEIEPEQPTERELADFTTGYLETLAWIGCYGGDHNGESLHDLTVDDLPADVVTESRGDCLDFLAANLGDVREFCEIVGDWSGTDSRGTGTYPAMNGAGGDFYLSRNGHGAGYFDRGAGKVGDRLQDAARVYGEHVCYIDSENGE